MKTLERPMESRIRTLAKQMGYRVIKSRQRNGLDKFGKFQLVEDRKNIVVLGSRYQATLEHILTYLEDHMRA